MGNNLNSLGVMCLFYNLQCNFDPTPQVCNRSDNLSCMFPAADYDVHFNESLSPIDVDDLMMMRRAYGTILIHSDGRSDSPWSHRWEKVVHHSSNQSSLCTKEVQHLAVGNFPSVMLQQYLHTLD